MTSPDPPRGRSRLETVPAARPPDAVRVPVRLRRRDDRCVSPGRRDAALEGRGGLASLWLRTVTGMVRTAARQHLDALWQDIRTRARPSTNSCTDPRRGRIAGAWHRRQHRDLQFSERPDPRRAPCCAGAVRIVGVYARSDGQVLPGRLTHAEFQGASCHHQDALGRSGPHWKRGSGSPARDASRRSSMPGLCHPTTSPCWACVRQLVGC